MWAEPYDSIEYLNQAESDRINGALIRLLRAHAYGNASLDSTNKKQARAFAEKAFENAKLARADMPDSQLAIAREFIANLNYVLLCQRSKDPQSTTFEAQARELMVKLSREIATNNSAVYQFLVETGERKEAVKFVNELEGNQLVDYLRIYRMFTGIHEGNIKDVQNDFNSFVHHRAFREPIAQVVELTYGVSPTDRQRIYERYSSNLPARLAREEFDTLEISWAVAKLLDAEQGQVDWRNLKMQNLRKVEECIREFAGTYIADIYQPMIDIEHMPPEQVIERSKHSRRRLSVACFVVGIQMLADGEPAGKAVKYFQMASDEGFYMFYTYAFSQAMVRRLAQENGSYYWQ